jgi:capsular exopolysaccharide synthesis family protein
MSKFYKALEQAQRDRALNGQPRPAPTAPSPEETVSAPPPPPRRPAQPARPVRPVSGAVDDHLVSLVAPAAFEAEQYRALRHLVEQRHRAENLSVVAVSSAAVGDGKTTTAINLAGALAQAPDARVLLVDADLRRPSIGPLLGLGSGGPGLVTAILNRTLSLEEITQSRPPFNLNVILGGQTPPSPYEVLKSPRLGELLDEARKQYDYVILDTPPLVSVQDCRVIARWVDGVLLVVGAHQTPRRLIAEALNVIGPAKMLGFVFNGEDHTLSRYLPGYYEYDATQPSTHNGSGGTLGRALRKVRAPFARPAPERARPGKRPRRTS